MKKIFLSFIILLSFLICTLKVYAVSDIPDMQSKYVGIYNAENMKLIYGENQNEKIPIASLTKLMTALVSIDNISNIEEKVTIDYNIVSSNLDPELSIAGIYNGQVLTYYDLLATMLIPSGADSAIFLANTLCGSYDEFINAMNKKAKELKMENTSFSNPTGLDDENNFSTISDVSKLLKAVLENDTLKEIISKNRYTTSDGELTVSSTINRTANRNGLTLDYILGGKTGTTEDAGQCLASYAVDDDTTLISIVTGASMYSSRPNNIIDSENLYKYVTDTYSKQSVIQPNDLLLTLNTICCKQDSVNFYSNEDVLDYIDTLDKNKINIIYNGIEELDYKIKVGAIIGKVDIYYDNVYLKSIDIKLNEKLNFSLIKWIKLNKKAIIITSSIIIFIIIAIIIINKSNKKKQNIFVQKK